MTYDQDLYLPPDYLVGTPKVENPFGKRILKRVATIPADRNPKICSRDFLLQWRLPEPLDPKRRSITD